MTTVGYGDVTPKSLPGRVVAGGVMLEGIALLAIVTAGVTSAFVRRAEQDHETEQIRAEDKKRERTEARFDSLDARLERIETALSKLTNP